MRIIVKAFLIALIILALVIVAKKQYSAMLPVLFLYLIGFACFLLFNYVGHQLMKMNLNISYPIAFTFSLLTLLCALAWLSGNTFSQILKTNFIERIEFLSFVDPYIIGSVVAYIMLLKGYPFCNKMK